MIKHILYLIAKHKFAQMRDKFTNYSVDKVASVASVPPSNAKMDFDSKCIKIDAECANFILTLFAIFF